MKRVFFALLFGLAPAGSYADLIVTAPTINHTSDAGPTSGFFDISLQLTGVTMADLAGFDVVVSLANPGVGTITIDSVTAAATNPLFNPPSGNFIGSIVGLDAQGSDDTFPDDFAVFNGAGLFRVAYTVSPLASGTAPITFMLNDLFDINGDPVANITMNGAINITAVPEPASLSLLGVACVGFTGWYRRNKRRTAVVAKA